MNIAAIVGIGLTAAALSAVLKRFGGGSALVISIAACAVILYLVITSLSPLLGFISELAEEAHTESAYLAVMMKALAVCYITGLAAESCRDSGEGAIAAKIELAGRTAVLLISVPLLKAIVDIVRGLII